MRKAYIAGFLVLLAVFSCLTFVLPGDGYSAVEDRPLAALPEWEGERLLDGSFQAGVEAFLQDHVPGREELLSVGTELRLLSGQRELNGVYVTGERLMENLPSAPHSITQMNCDEINAFARNFRDLSGATVALVPTALEIYAEERPLFSSKMDQASYIQNFYKALLYSRNVDLIAPLTMASEQYIFYRTDHRLTSYGAYTVYTALAKSLGYRASSLDNFNIEHVSHDFLGTLYTKALTGRDLADTIDLYDPVAGDPVTNVIRYNGSSTVDDASLIQREKLQGKDPYRVYTGDGAEVTRVLTNVGNGKKLLVFSDDLIWPMLQFLTLHYAEIAIVDLQELEHSLYDYLNPVSYQQVLFLYGLTSFTSSADLAKLREYCI